MFCNHLSNLFSYVVQPSEHTFGASELTSVGVKASAIE